jgi:hypothetical protein
MLAGASPALSSHTLKRGSVGYLARPDSTSVLRLVAKSSTAGLTSVVEQSPIAHFLPAVPAMAAWQDQDALKLRSDDQQLVRKA